MPVAPVLTVTPDPSVDDSSTATATIEASSSVSTDANDPAERNNMAVPNPDESYQVDFARIAITLNKVGVNQKVGVEEVKH